MSQRPFIAMLSLAILAACEPSRPAPNRPARAVVAPRAVGDACPELSADELARAKPMTWTNPDHVGPGYVFAMARLRLRRERGRLVLDEDSTPAFSTSRLSEAEHAARRRELEALPADTFAPGALVEVTSASGTRTAPAIVGQGGYGAGPPFEAHFTLEPDAKRVRFMLDGSVLYEVDLEIEVPKVEALVLPAEPLQIAVRVHGAIGATAYDLFLSADGMLPGTSAAAGVIKPGSPGSAPCWKRLTVTARPEASGPSSRLTLWIQNALRRFEFRLPESPN
jgi:hypothetical protein